MNSLDGFAWESTAPQKRLTAPGVLDDRGTRVVAAALTLLPGGSEGVGPRITGDLRTVALAASLVPGWRATRIDPMEAVKTE